MVDKVSTPADFVPLHAMAYGAEGSDAVAVSSSAPLPVASGPDAAVRAGMAFFSSTPIVEVSTAEGLYIKLDNTSGRNLFLYNRIFANSLPPDADHMQYRAFINPTATLTQAATGANADIGNVASGATVTYQVAEGLAMGGIEGTGEQLPNGEPYSRPLLVKVSPGVSVGFSVQPTGNPASSSKLSIILEWWEEPI